MGKASRVLVRRAVTLCLCVFFSSSLAARPRRDPPLLFGGAPEPRRREVTVDPRLPTGARVSNALRPAQGGERICSFHRPVCVHVGRVSIEHGLRALSALEWAYERVVLSLGLPAPLGDAGEGGTDELDAYLEPSGGAFGVEALALRTSGFTRAPAFCRLPVEGPALLRRAATLCIAEATALALDASEPPHVRRAFATSLWWTVGEPTSLDVQAIDDIQAHPEEPIITSDLGPSSEGAALFFDYLEEARSGGSPGELSAALLAAAASRTDEVGLSYRNEPDVVDVLRHSVDEDGARFARLMVDFSIHRAFVGAREDGVHLPALGFTGDFGRARFDWVIPFSSLPRRVSLQPPIDSFGTGLVWIDLDEVPIGVGLGARIEWEAPVSFQWQIVKVSKDGEELERIDVPFQERSHSAEVRVSRLEGARSLILAGTNLEGIALNHPFDPDVAPFEPHGVTVYLVRL